MTRPITRIVSVVCVLTAIALSGCSDSPTFAEVSGTLTAKGKPLGNVQVEFWPEVSGPRSIGVTDKDGKFTLTSDDGKRSGAVVGSHKVVIVDLDTYANVPVNRPRDVEKVDLKSTRFGPKYSDPNRTLLKATVESGKENVIELDAGQ
jgi:hypothetical protein